MASKLHDELTYKTLYWLNNRAWDLRWCSELTISNSCVVDASAIYYPKRDHRIKLGLPEPVSDKISCVFESKISKPDFNNTFGVSSVRPRCVPLAHIHWIVTPKDIITHSDVPDPWGWLVQRGRGLKIERLPRICDIDELQMLRLANAILWKREPWFRKHDIELLEQHFDDEEYPCNT